MNKLVSILNTLKRAWVAFIDNSDEPLSRRLQLFWNVILLKVESLKGKSLVKRRIHGYTMWLDLARPGIAFELAEKSSREELDTKIFSSTVQPGMTVVDLGANIGYYTLLAASRVGSQGKVFAIEPLPENYAMLTRNIQVNHLESIVEASNMAISNFEGSATFFLGEADNLGTLMDYSKINGADSDSIQVQTTTLDKFMDGCKVDYLRMDIEGSECEVFDGMTGIFSQEIPPRILFEVHPEGRIDPDPRFTPHFEFLISRGYVPKYLVASRNPRSAQALVNLGYAPKAKAKNGHTLFEDINLDDLIKVGARRPKITRALYLVHKDDHR